MKFQIDTDALAKMVTVDDDHLWGRELRLVNEEVCGKLLELQDPWVGSSRPPHFHKEKWEAFVVLSGEVYIELDGSEGELVGEVYGVGAVIMINPGQVHRFYAVGKPALLLEVSTHHRDDDTYRLEESGEIGGVQ